MLMADSPSVAGSDKSQPTTATRTVSHALPTSKISCMDEGWKFARFGPMPNGTRKLEPGAPAPLAQASTSEAGNTPAMALDGNPSTRWCAVRGGSGESFTVDMGVATAAAKLSVLWEKAGVHQFKLEGSQDGNTWQTLVDQTANTTRADRTECTVAPTPSRFFRITITDNDISMWASIREFVLSDAQGKKLSPQPAPEANMKSPAAPDYDDSGWRTLNLPHDWGVEGPFRMDLPNNTGKLPWAGIGWYRKTINIPATSRDNRFYLDFDGAMSRPEIFVNGVKAGEWKYGYSSFRIDITPFVKFGEDNLIAVRLDNPPNSSRWYPGGGIYRHVRLVETNPVHLDHWGVYVRTPEISKDKAVVQVETSVVNHTDKPQRAFVTQKILNKGQVVAVGQSTTGLIAPGSTGRSMARIDVAKPILWDIANPHLYQVETTITLDGKTIDTTTTNLGIRTIEWTADDGFHLNGRRVQLNGVCQHHDLGPLGSAVHTRGYERQIEILKEMGVNAIRTSHNPPAPELLDLCDRMGILVMDELFDMWESAKNTNDYHLYFNEWHERDLINFVRRDRNHPSIILWSGGNEVHEQGDPSKHYISERLTELFHREDPSRLVGIGCSGASGIKNGFADTVDVFGGNYKYWQYAEFEKLRPDLPAFGSETTSCLSSRGEYFFPVSWDKGAGFYNFQVSSYDLYAPGWAYRPDLEFKGQDANKRIAGEFVWTGFDYIGEPTPYNHDATNALNFSNEAEKKKAMDMFEKLGRGAPSRSSYFGIVDLCGFKKDRFYLYQARWRPEVKMAHILPHWNWPDRLGKITPVHVYTSGDTAELFLNGKSLGIRKKGVADDNAYRLVWKDVVYQPGELKVVVTKNGQPWATDVVKTTGPAASFTIEADRSIIAGDGQDLSYLTITMKDANGLVVPTAKTPLEFTVEGPAEIAGVCNGDATDFTPFQGNKINAYNGLAQVVIRGKRRESGTVTVTGNAQGMKPVSITLTVKPAK